MTTETIRRRKSLGRILALATDPVVMSWPVILISAALSVLIHLAPNGTTVQGSILVRIAIATLAYIPGLGVVALASILIRPVRSTRWRRSVMLCSYFVGGAVRGLFLALGFYSLGMADSLNLDFRIPGSAIPFGLAIAATTYAVAALDESKARIHSLRALEAQLSEAVAGSAGMESGLRFRTISAIEASIEGELASLTNIPVASTAEDLRSLAAEVVRPLSHLLAERIPVWTAPTPAPGVLRWREVFARVRPELSLRPTLLAVLATATGLTSFVYFFGAARAVPLALCSFVLIYTATRAAQPLAARLNGIRNGLLRGVVMTLILMAVSLPAGLVAALITRYSFDPFFVVKGGLVVVPIFGWFIALGGAAQAESARIEGDFNAGIQRLSWLRARLNLMSWFELGEFARVLHGPVQSAINKGVITLSSGTGSSRADVIGEVRQGIEHALATELRGGGRQPSFEQSCADLALTWEDLCQIDFAISPIARRALNADQASASVGWDIIHESCGNAINHGKATWVSVRIPDPQDDVITIDVVDNGIGYVFASQPGMGSNMLDACTIEWSRESVENQTVLRAAVPISAPSAPEV